MLHKNFVKLISLIAVVFLVSVAIVKSAAEAGRLPQEKISQKIELLKVKCDEYDKLRYASPDQRSGIKELAQEITTIKEQLISTGRKAVPLLLEALEPLDESRDVFASNLADVLTKIGEPAVPFIIKDLSGSGSEYKKIILIKILGNNLEKRQSKEIVLALQKYLQDKSSDIQESTIEALQYAGEYAVKPLCEQLLKESDIEIRKSILDSIKHINSKSALPYLHQALGDEAVRIDVVFTISKISGEPITATISKLLAEGKITKQDEIKCKEEAVKDGLANLRSALNIYHANNDGVFPTGDLEKVLVPDYLKEIPTVDTGIDGFPVTNKVKYGKVPDNTGGWLYNSDRDDPDWGNIIVNCTEKDSTGVVWSSY